MKSHVLITRFHYADNDPRFEWRFAFYKAMVLPRILRQEDQDFDIAIRCNRFHAARFEELSPRIMTFQTGDDTAHYKRNGMKRYFHDFVPWEAVSGLPKYDIQSGLDSDDLIGPDYIRIINETFRHETEATHLCFQPELFRLQTLRIEPMREYSRERGSAFRSLYQPDKGDGYKFIDGVSHMILGRYANKTVVIPKGHCFAVAHHFNESTGK